MKKVGFDFKGKNIELEVKECKSVWSKSIGLMFSRREKACALLFDFGKEVEVAIHSFFCPEFVGVWIDQSGKVIEIKRVKPWRLSVRPKEKFVKLVEIPINEKYKRIINSLDG